MAIKIKYQLTDEEVEILEQAIRMLHLGKYPREVAQVLAVSVPTLYNWHARWRQAGLEGLANRPKSGRPRKANEAYYQVLAETLAKEPPELGYAFMVWTV
jgi:transposase